MIRSDVVQTSFIQVAGKVASDLALRSGQTLKAVVEAGKPNPVLLLAGNRVSLPENTPLTPGQTVTVEVQQGDSGIRLRIVPPEATQVSSQGLSPTLTDVAARVLNALGASLPPDSAAALVPAQVPASQEAVRVLLSLFASRGAVAQDLATVAQILTQAGAEGTIPSQLSAQFTALLAHLVADDPSKVVERLQQMLDQSTRSTEAKIATLVASGDQGPGKLDLTGDLRAFVTRLREDPSLTANLQRSGRLQEFQGAVDRVTDRLTGSQLQNMRGLEQPYLFVELPFAPNGPIRNAQIHLFGEGGRKNEWDAANAMVVLDVSTTRLGDLWISLRMSNGHCACRICAVDQETVETLQTASDELKSAIEGAGYRSASVQVAQWNGDRLSEVARLMRPFSGLNMKA